MYFWHIVHKVGNVDIQTNQGEWFLERHLCKKRNILKCEPSVVFQLGGLKIHWSNKLPRPKRVTSTHRMSTGCAPEQMEFNIKVKGWLAVPRVPFAHLSFVMTPPECTRTKVCVSCPTSLTDQRDHLIRTLDHRPKENPMWGIIRTGRWNAKVGTRVII